jgi:uncharacterized protein with FMN-binding domain
MTARPHASLGRRLLPAVVLTTAASGLVALLDQPSTGSATDVPDSSTVAADQGGGVVAATTPPPVSSTTPVAAEQPAQPDPQPTTTSAPAAAAPAAAGECAGQTIDGPTIDTRWGPVQVEAVVSSSGQICDVDAIQSPNDHGRSVRINQQALPILHDEVMDAQSAGIDNVSGATITTRGYRQSLQSILDGGG